MLRAHNGLARAKNKYLRESSHIVAVVGTLIASLRRARGGTTQEGCPVR